MSDNELKPPYLLREWQGWSNKTATFHVSAAAKLVIWLYESWSFRSSLISHKNQQKRQVTRLLRKCQGWFNKIRHIINFMCHLMQSKHQTKFTPENQWKRYVTSLLKECQGWSNKTHFMCQLMQSQLVTWPVLTSSVLISSTKFAQLPSETLLPEIETDFSTLVYSISKPRKYGIHKFQLKV